MIVQLHAPLVLAPQHANTDAYYPLPTKAANARLFVVADGRGTPTNGSSAAHIAIEAIVEALQSHDLDHHTLTDADVLHAFARATDALERHRLGELSASIALLAFHRGGATAAFVGNARIYQLRSAAHEVLFQSRDHTEAYDRLEAGEITIDQLLEHPSRQRLTRSLNPRHPSRNQPNIVHLTDLRPADAFLLATDGFSEGLTPAQVAGRFDARQSVDKLQHLLQATAIDAHDEATALFVSLQSITLEATDTATPTPLHLLPANAMRLHPMTDTAATPPQLVAPIKRPSAMRKRWQNFGDFWVRYRTHALWAVASVVGILLLLVIVDNLDKFQCSAEPKTETSSPSTDTAAAPAAPEPEDETLFFDQPATPPAAAPRPVEPPKVEVEELPAPEAIEPTTPQEAAPALPNKPVEVKPTTPKPSDVKPTESQPATPKPNDPAGPLKES